MSNFQLGRHINISKGFLTAPSYAKSIGCSIFQIFLGAPQQILSKAKNEEELIKFGAELKKEKIKMVVHGSYTINLCHPIKTKRFTDSVKSLVQDLNSSYHFGSNCLGVIIHMGKNIPANGLTDEEAIDNYVLGLEQALNQTPSDTVVILETGASQGSEVASDIDGLSEIYWKTSENLRHRIMFCIDTCHIWATGYDISSKVGVKKFFKEFEDKIGVEKISCIHFNDSKTGLHSCVDRHADLGYGLVGEEGLKNIAIFAKKNKIPIIMETPLDSVNKKTNRDITFAEELAKVKSWIKDQV